MNPVSALFAALPGSVAQGLIWGIMAIGVYITFKILDFADLTVDIFELQPVARIVKPYSVPKNQ